MTKESTSTSGVVGGRRKGMVVADPGRESAGTLQWALSHVALDKDEIILLCVDPSGPFRRAPLSMFLRRPNEGRAASSEFPEEMKNRCREAQPRVGVPALRVEMKDSDKGGTVLSRSKSLGIDILAVGQPRRSSFFGGRLTGGTKGMDKVEYLIKNSKCLCVAVQNKGQGAGYVLNAKTLKNFWLLA